MSRDAPPHIQKCSVCGSLNSVRKMQWRCHDCFGEPAFCTPCIQARHVSHPFHRISRWEGTCFSRSSLAKAGLTLNLGHGGNLCPRYITRSHETTLKTPRPSRKTTATPGIAGFEFDPKISAPDFLSIRTPSSPAGHVSPQLPTSSSTQSTQPSPLPGLGRSCAADEMDLFFSSSISQSDMSGRFWEITGSIPYEQSPLKLLPQPPLLVSSTEPQTSASVSSYTPVTSEMSKTLDENTPIVFGELDTTDDPFFANESEEEDDWKSIETGGVPVKAKKRSQKMDILQCPMLTIVDTTGVHELCTRFCRCHELKDNPLHKQLLNMGLYPASTERTRTVFTF